MSAVVAASALSVGYGKRAVVADITFKLEAGSTLALVGVNGSGKSTFLKTVAGLLPALAGEVRVLDDSPGRHPARVAYLGQFHPSQSVLPLRVVDVVRMARYPSLGLVRRRTREDERLVHEAMAATGVADLAARPLSALSGGLRQRVFLAQAVARDAGLLLLDEPETNLDVNGRDACRSLVASAAREGRTVVVATHDINEATRYDFAMLLAQRVVAFGPGCSVMTPESLLATFGVIARIEGGNIVVSEHEHREPD